MLFIIVKPAACAVALLSASTLAAAGSLVDVLPSGREYTQSGVCACSFYTGKPASPFSQVLFTSTSESARVVVQGVERELNHIQRRASGKQWVNSFRINEVQAILRSREVAFRQLCSKHPDPPPHGSCFVSHLRIKVGAQAELLHGVEVCAC
jgi:hypothetical protein